MNGPAASGYLNFMLEPIPETRKALAELIAMEGPDLDERLIRMGRSAREVVPSLVGLSLTLVQDGLTFTLASSSPGVASLDATQYIDGGPCVQAAEDAGDPIATEVEDLLDEGRWTLFGLASAAGGIASTLSLSTTSLPGRELGGINLYAATPNAFVGRHERLREALEGSAGAMTTNADLGFRTREHARLAPNLILANVRVDTAVGYLAARFDESIEDARRRLTQAAQRAEVDPVLVAQILLLTQRPAE
ncbi:hypothetical protein NOCA2480019 [metagenome]|uniref:ANTAR domain-containing protein n=1 Tax=metagenome TaxID=256318 RepID=A0A2P2CAM8_9ZZZZ